VSAAWLAFGDSFGRTQTVQPAGATANADSTTAAIPAGDYTIGTDRGPTSTTPSHRVRVEAFKIERTEVTVDAYEKFIIATRAPAPWGTTRPLGTLPVTRVTWGDAANYCAWRHRPGGRLPTEFEWEAAARGTAGRAYPYGSVAGTASANTESARRGAPAPVGSFPRGATPDGVHDMSGNVWEWTSSPMHAYPGGKPLPDSMSEYRVIRGGAFDTSDSIATTTSRGYFKVSASPDELPKIGFRCVLPS
jgi:formylglycine-generating enzyme required for sulfatase activity